MQVTALAIPEVKLLTPRRIGDARGWFSVTWQARQFAEAGVDAHFVQDNHSLSARPFTVRALHCQIGANAQAKLVRVVRGSVWDVAVDVRHGSPTYGQFAAAELSAANGSEMWVPTGFLHGFCTLEPDTEVVYKVTAEYDPDAERGVLWTDPDLGLPWPVPPGEALLSDKDTKLPRLAECDVWFRV